MTYCLPGVLRLTNSDTNELGTQECKDSIDKRAPETVKFARRTCGDIRLERARLVVVLETSCGSRATTDSENEREQNDTDDDYHLDRTEPELKLTEELDSEVIDRADQDEEDQNPDSRVDSFRVNPFLNDQGGGSQLVGRRDNVLAPVSPTESETESRVTKAGSVTGESRSMRDPSGHLTKSSHDDVDEETDGCVSDED